MGRGRSKSASGWCARFVVLLSVCQLSASPALGQSAPRGADVAPPLEGGPVVAPEEATPAEPSPSSENPSAAPAAADAPADAAASHADTPVPCVDEPLEAPPVTTDHEAVFRAFAVYAASERDRRIIGGVAGVVAGATTIVLGATIAEPTGTDPTVWYVIGGVSAGLSLLGLLLPSPAEAMARSYRVGEAEHTESEARALEIRWNDYAQAAQRRRITGGAVSLLVSAVALGSGVAIATGAGDFTDDDRYFWGTFLIASGAAAGISGVAGLLIKSPAERSFEAYRAVRPSTARLAPLLGGGPGGVFVGARGSF